MTDFCWADHLALHQYCRWVGEDTCSDLGNILPCVCSTGMLPGGWGGRRRTSGIITQGICWFSDSCFGGWIIVASICYTECSALALYFFPSFTHECCWFTGRTGSHTYASTQKKQWEGLCWDLLWTLSLPGEAVGSLQRSGSTSPGPSSRSSFSIFCGTHIIPLLLFHLPWHPAYIHPVHSLGPELIALTPLY